MIIILLDSFVDIEIIKELRLNLVIVYNSTYRLFENVDTLTYIFSSLIHWTFPHMKSIQINQKLNVTTCIPIFRSIAHILHHIGLITLQLYKCTMPCFWSQKSQILESTFFQWTRTSLQKILSWSNLYWKSRNFIDPVRLLQCLRSWDMSSMPPS